MAHRRPSLHSLMALALLAAALAAGPAAASPQPGARVPLPLLMRNYAFGPGDVVGRVMSASTGNGLTGASVCLGNRCQATAPDGSFQFTALDAGYHALAASAAGFTPKQSGVAVAPNQATTLNFALAPQIPPGGTVEMRFVLTWDPRPSWPPAQHEDDLDAYLWMEGPLARLIFSGDPGECTAYPNACLEADKRDGFGPETVALTRKEAGVIYHYAVLNFNQGRPGVPLISGTAAQVEVYDHTGLVASFAVPSGGAPGQDLWYVFRMDSAGEITPVNCLAASPSEGQLPHCSGAAGLSTQAWPRPPKQ